MRHAQTMPARRTTTFGGSSTPTAGRQQTIARGRSSMFQRLGTLALDAPSTPPEAAVGTTSLIAEAVGDSEASAAAQAAMMEEPTGLTPASLKHVKRQRDKLAEEKVKLEAEIAELMAKLKELKAKVKEQQAELEEAAAREEKLTKELKETQAREEAERNRADEAEKVNAKLEETLAVKEAEIDRLRKALDDQRQLTEEVCEAAERRERNSDADARVLQLEALVKQLQAEKQKILDDMQKQEAQQEEMKRNVALAMAAAEKAMAMHAQHAGQVDSLRAAKLADAINQKVELHISVPRVTLSYNNAPPLLVSVAETLGEGRIRSFLDKEVFPHFEPLWVRVDSLDKAPDGSSKKTYSTRMLDRLTAAVKAFVLRSQEAQAGDDLAKSGIPQDNDSATKKSSGTRSSSAEISDSEREQLLRILKSGDDNGLDSKLQEMMASRGGR
eukprot:TRINITY_DN1946_c0_g1_i1.p1 TRINITY_DN1946_c0_g1~~TRINITY_DN1946_c0_g1_i1.p1  ORF type:complete len:452 (+),score=128.93 TRINITY_DN1946_c0_g1_i1:28-1356(+)